MDRMHFGEKLRHAPATSCPSPYLVATVCTLEIKQNEVQRKQTFRRAWAITLSSGVLSCGGVISWTKRRLPRTVQGSRDLPEPTGLQQREVACR